MDGLIKHSATINKLLARYGVKFGIYKNGEFKEQLFPFAPIPRVIGHDEFSYLGTLIEEITAPVDGIVFFHASQPIIYSHTSLFRIIPTQEIT